MQQVENFATCKGVQDLLNPWHQNLIDDLATPLRKNESSTELLDILGIKLVNIRHHVLLDELEEEWAPEARDREATSTTCHLICRHLVKPLHKQCLQLHKQFRERFRYLRKGLEHSEQIKS
jgi:hypothetical protein